MNSVVDLVWIGSVSRRAKITYKEKEKSGNF
jgi:hypothetical protein